MKTFLIITSLLCTISCARQISQTPNGLKTCQVQEDCDNASGEFCAEVRGYSAPICIK